jgi:hypothetical protein
MSQQIIFKGKTYASVDEMPPDVRQVYDQVMKMLPDKNQNGVPDILEGGSLGMLKGLGGLLADADHDGKPDFLENIQAGTVTQTTFVVDGKTYYSLDELPPDARQKYEAAMSKMDANRDGVPDLLMSVSTPGQTVSQSAKSANTSAWLTSVEPKPAVSSMLQPPVIETESSDGRLALAGCVVIVLVIGAALMAYLLWLR